MKSQEILQMNKSTIELKGQIYDLDDITKQTAHYLIDSIFEKQEQGEEVDSATYQKIVLTEEGEMKRITCRVNVNIEVERYGY